MFDLSQTADDPTGDQLDTAARSGAHRALLLSCALPALALAGLASPGAAQAQSAPGCTISSASKDSYLDHCVGADGSNGTGGGQQSGGIGGNPGNYEGGPGTTPAMGPIQLEGGLDGSDTGSTVSILGQGGDGGAGGEGPAATPNVTGGGYGGAAPEIKTYLFSGTYQSGGQALPTVQIVATGGDGGAGGEIGLLEQYGTAGAAGQGGVGGNIHFTLWSDSTIVSSHQQVAALDLENVGGLGGNGGSGTRNPGDTNNAPDGAYGGPGAYIYADIYGTIGSTGTGVLARSLGSLGGKGGDLTLTGNGALHAGNGGIGGAAATVSVNVHDGGVITTSGANAIGIDAQSIGGKGGNGGDLLTNSSSARSGSGGDGGTPNGVTITNDGRIVTNGDLAHGISAKTLGGEAGAIGNGNGNGSDYGKRGNGGIISITGAGSIETDGARSIGLWAVSAGNAAGPIATNYAHGGPVTIDYKGPITTQGKDSYGVVAQSVGAGALFTPDGIAVNNSVDSFFGNGKREGIGGTVSVTQRDGSQITTSGDGAVGILAQSLGGGGGLVGGMSAVDVTQHVASSAGNNRGMGGNISIALEPHSYITTNGTRAHAIVAQTGVGAGFFGGVNGAGFTVNTTSTCSDGCAPAGNISMLINGIVSTKGPQSYAVYASNTNGPAATTTISIGGNGVISGSAATIYFDGNATNTLNNGGYLGGTVAVDGAGATINNGYFMSGDILVRSGQHIINNYGTIWARTTVQAASLANNAGGRIVINQATSLTGTLTSPGDIVTQVDGNGNYGSLTVGGAANVTGRILVWGAPVPGQAMTVLRAASLSGGTPQAMDVSYSYDTEQFTPNANTLTNYQVQVQNNQAIVVTAKVQNSQAFGEALTPDQAETADYLADTFNAGGARDLFVALYANVETPQDYAEALNTIGGQALGAMAASRLTLQRGFIDSMMSCPVFGDESLAMPEESCFWGRVQGSWVNDSHSTNFKTNSVRYQLGGQGEIGDGWFLGASSAYEGPNIDSSSTATHFDGDVFSAGAFVKRVTGKWTLGFSASGAIARYTTRREVAFSDTLATAKPKVQNIGLQARAAFQQPMKGWYLRPMLSATVQYLHLSAFTETGSDFPLAVAGSSHWSWSLAPGVELGGRVKLGPTVLRPFVRGGLLYEHNNDWSHQVSLAGGGADLGSFTSHIDLPDLSGQVGGGFEAYASNRLTIRAEYGAELASGYTSQTAVFRLGYRF